MREVTVTLSHGVATEAKRVLEGEESASETAFKQVTLSHGVATEAKRVLTGGAGEDSAPETLVKPVAPSGAEGWTEDITTKEPAEQVPTTILRHTGNDDDVSESIPNETNAKQGMNDENNLNHETTFQLDLVYGRGNTAKNDSAEPSSPNEEAREREIRGEHIDEGRELHYEDKQLKGNNEIGGEEKNPRETRDESREEEEEEERLGRFERLTGEGAMGGEGPPGGAERCGLETLGLESLGGVNGGSVEVILGGENDMEDGAHNAEAL